MNHYNYKHALKLILPLFVLIAGCSFPIERKTQLTVTPEAPVIFLSPQATASSFVSPTPTVIALLSSTQSNPTLDPSVSHNNPNSAGQSQTSNNQISQSLPTQNTPSTDSPNSYVPAITDPFIPEPLIPMLRSSPSPVPTIALPAVKRPHRKTADKPAQPTPITICSACSAD